jgi:hypothetical protein
MDNELVTKKDLEAFGKEFEAKLDAKLEAKLTEKLGGLKDELTEAIRDAQSEILRGFHAFQTGWNLRLGKLEADHTNLDTATVGRLNNLEQRVFEIERKLMGGGPQ